MAGLSILQHVLKAENIYLTVLYSQSLPIPELAFPAARKTQGSDLQ